MAATKTTKTAPKSAKKDEAASAKEREQAKACDLTLVQFRILTALVRAGQPLTYRDIEAKTGYYSILTSQLREEHEGSLGAEGLVSEKLMDDDDGKQKLHFAATAAGKKRLAKAK